jgi:hypothetical protein
MNFVSPTNAIVWAALLLLIQDVTSSILDLATGNLTEVFRGFPSSLQTDSGIVSRNGTEAGSFHVLFYFLFIIQ